MLGLSARVALSSRVVRIDQHRAIAARPARAGSKRHGEPGDARPVPVADPGAGLRGLRRCDSSPARAQRDSCSTSGSSPTLQGEARPGSRRSPAGRMSGLGFDGQPGGGACRRGAQQQGRSTQRPAQRPAQKTSRKARRISPGPSSPCAPGRFVGQSPCRSHHHCPRSCSQS